MVQLTSDSATAPTGSPVLRGLCEKLASASLFGAVEPLVALQRHPSRPEGWRTTFVVAFVGIFALCLLARAFEIQVQSSDFYAMQGEKRFLRAVPEPAARGRIMDRNGVLLADSLSVWSLWVDSRAFTADNHSRNALAFSLGLAPDELKVRIEKINGYARLAKGVHPDVAGRIFALGLYGIYFQQDAERTYGLGEAAAQLVGLTSDGRGGVEGLELQLNSELSGRGGQRVVMRDRLGRVVEEIGERVSALNGSDVVLTIDAPLQQLAYENLEQLASRSGAKAASAVILDVSTGGLLAVAGFPSYNPLLRQRLLRQDMRNRAFTDVFEPGWMAAPFVVASALEKGLVSLDTPVRSGPLKVGRHLLDEGDAGMRVRDLIRNPNRPGIARLALKMRPSDLWSTFDGAGFGRKPTVFIGAVSGRLRQAEAWRPIEAATLGFGQGLSASLLQIAQAYTIFATDGDRREASLLLDASDSLGTPVLSPETARSIRALLSEDVRRISLRTDGFAGLGSSFSKLAGSSYDPERRNFVYVGMAPLARPRVVVALHLDEPATSATTQKAMRDLAVRMADETLKRMRVPSASVNAPLTVPSILPSESDRF
jgi:cell division protein FtsI (penicillin-binding protein 3)